LIMTKLLLVIDNLEFGGGERGFLQLASGLKDRFEIYFAATPGGRLESELNRLGIRFYPLDMRRRLSFKPIYQINNIISSNKIDLVHSQGARADFYSRVAGRVAGAPHILSTIQMPVEGFDVGPLRKIIYRLLDQFSERFVGRFIVVSDSLKKILTEGRGIPTQRVVLIYNGIEVDKYHPDLEETSPRNNWKIPPNVPLIAAIGRMVWQKGFEFLIRAMPNIIAASPETRLLLVGDGPLRIELEDLAKQLNVFDKIIFTGFRSDISQILSTVDVLAVPSLLEGFPMIILEGMAMAKPIVATKIQGITEQLTEGKQAILVPPRNSDALSDALLKLIQDAKLASMLGIAARRKVENYFSVEKMVEETDKVYLSLIESTATKSCPYCCNPGESFFAINARAYNHCIACDLIYRDTSESYGKVIAGYRKNYFDRYSAEQLAGQREEIYGHILDLIAGKKGGGKLLDVGTGCGFFLVAAQKRQWDVKGVEPSIQSVQVARRQNGLDVYNGTLQEYDKNSYFDVITFINVLEHSTLPWREIARAKEILRPGGLIYLRFPNGSLHSRIYRMAHKYGLANLIRNFLVFHKYSFSTRYISRLLHDHGFVRTTIFNSPTSEGDPNELFLNPTFATYVKRLIYLTAKCTETISCRRLFWGTSLEVIATKPENPQAF
jgi:glycosyltransferase involved in cell wall biosynthesis/2-polyprenyl-3-methyl-5-hydroxy-6-metoxy-1,4-benzoquinol methylase